LDRIRRTGVLLVGVTEDDPPFSFREPGSGELVGYDVDFLSAVAGRLGVTMRLRAVDQDQRLEELLDGGIDVLAGGLTRNSAREAVLGLSESYVVSGQKLIARKGQVSRLEDLQGKRIGTVVGTFAEACARDRCTVSRIVPFDGYVEGMRALEDGKIDAFSADETILIDLAAGLSSEEYEIPELLLVRETYHFGVRKADKDLLEFLNRTIAAMEQVGEPERIRAVWFTPQLDLAPPAYGSVVRKAATRPRFLGVVLGGVLYPDSEVSVFSINGERLGAGRVISVYGDEFYVDVEESIYNNVRPGFLVAMNMNANMAMDVLMRRQHLLEGVQDEAESLEAQVDKAITQEAAAKEQRAIEMDTYRQRLEEASKAARDRDQYYNRGRYYRGSRYYRGRSRRLYR
jgi:polar amino acid transport system substrate-binding protein